MRWTALIAVACFLAPFNVASAQFGVGAAYGRGPYMGFWTGPAFGYVPGAYQGFWSNGYSLYGPPVPTYGSIPGFFGGYDQRLSNTPDFNDLWYSPWGYRGGYVPLGRDPNQICAPIIGMAICEIHLPAGDAELFVNGNRAEAQGTIRNFRVAVPPARGVTYEMEARWATPENIGAARRTVILRAGETVIVDFTKPEG